MLNIWCYMYFHIRQLSTPRFEEKPSEFSLEGSKNPWISNQLETLLWCQQVFFTFASLKNLAHEINVELFELYMVFSYRPTDWWTGLFTSPHEFLIDWGDRTGGFQHPCLHGVKKVWDSCFGKKGSSNYRQSNVWLTNIM